MRTRVKDHHAVWFRLFQRLYHALHVDSPAPLVPVVVLHHLQAARLEQLPVDRPRRPRHVHRSAPLDVPPDQLADHTQTTCATQHLCACDSLLPDGGRVTAEQHDLCGRLELVQPVYRQVLLVGCGVVGQLLLGLADDGEDVRLALIGPVRPSDGIDLLSTRVRFVCARQGDDCVVRRLREALEERRLTAANWHCCRCCVMDVWLGGWLSHTNNTSTGAFDR
mmetsp:Transcript_46551/g.115923  ORF Transcript_46551/g.115923 Transcript_46551/m.115923 type:complete len:222 (-) Transcript_46551:192-857(-)